MENYFQLFSLVDVMAVKICYKSMHIYIKYYNADYIGALHKERF